MSEQPAVSSIEHLGISHEGVIKTNNTEEIQISDVVTSAVTDSVCKRRCWDEAFETSSDSNEEGDETDCTKYKWMCAEPPGAATTTAADARGEGSSEVTQIVCDAHPGCLKSFSTAREYEEHYELRHKHKCSVCKKSLPSYHILELHVLEAHDTLFSLMAERKPMLQCFLESCSEMSWSSKQRKKHCLSTHSFPKSFKFWYLSSARKHKGSKNEKGSNGGKKSYPSGSCKQCTNNDNKNGHSISTDQMHFDESSDVKSLTENVEMDIDTAGTTKTKQKSKGPTTKHVVQSHKSVPSHITFGHSAPRSFKNNYSFGINKPTPNKVGSVPNNLNSEEMNVDLTDMKDVLPTTSNDQ